MTEPLIINNWEEGIAASPYKGNGLLRNLDIESFPGAVKAAKKATSAFHAAVSGTFTADAGSDVCTTATAPDDRSPVRLTTTGTLPAGLATNTDYFVIRVSATTFKLATSWENSRVGTAINITDAGTGTHTITTTNPGTINHTTRDAVGKTFCIDSNGRLWFRFLDVTKWILVIGNTLTNGNGNGIACFTNSSGSAYVFVFRNAVIDVVVNSSTLATTPSWTSSWQTMNTGSGTNNPHHALLGQDNIVYYTDDKYVGSIQENSGSAFDPSNAATYTFSQDALDLPNGEVAQWLEEQGTNLLIAGKSWNKIYPWDRTSASFNLPIIVPETNVQRLKNIGGTVFILAGSKGRIYKTLGVTVEDFVTIPVAVQNSGDTVQYTQLTWGGIAERSGALLVGVSGITTANNGVWLIYPDGRMTIDATPSAGGSAYPTSIMQGPNYPSYTSDDFYMFGYANGGDLIDVSRYAADTFAGVYQSLLYQLATKTGKASYSVLEVQINKPAATGNVRVGYRTDTSSAFTTLATFTADGSATSFKADIGITDLENIQIQAEVDGAMELREIRLFP